MDQKRNNSEEIVAYFQEFEVRENLGEGIAILRQSDLSWLPLLSRGFKCQRSNPLVPMRRLRSLACI